jgi:SAM-dependent methyltransferase
LTAAGVIEASAPGAGAREALLAKLRCGACGGAGLWRDGAVCAGGHHFSLPVAARSGPRPWGERVFDHPQALGAKVALLSLLNGIPRASLERFTAGAEVLDLGCGSYQYHYRPERTSARIGIDLSARCTATADRLYPRSLHLTASLADPLPFADGSFDVVLLLSVLHHLPRAIVPGVLREAARVARREVLVLDHTRSDVAWKRGIQQRYWDTFDGGDLYRSAAEWDALLAGYRVTEHRRLGVLFRNVCLYRLER